MSFKGIVTRKDEDTGVNLLAKIVTPNKKKSTKKTFSVKVKANALSDFECCVIDLATARSKILSGINTSDVKSNVPMSYYGENGTTISYKIIDLDSSTGKSALTKYLKQDGKINGRPKYGEQDAEGFIEIKASKNDASTSTRISVTIKQTSAKEVLYDGTYFTMATIWNIIKGKNDAYSTNIASSGHKNIKENLNLPSNYTFNALTNVPVNFEYDIKGGDITINNKQYTRMDSSGVYGSIPYAVACPLVGTDAVISGTSNLRYIVIGGLKIKVTIKLDDEERVFEYDCATRSNRISNKEVLEALLTKGIFQYYTSINGINEISHPFKSSESTTTPDYIFSAVDDGTGEITVINCNAGGTGSRTIEIPSLHLERGEVLFETSYTIKNIQGTGNYDDLMISQAFNGGVWVPNSENDKTTLTFTFDDFYAADSDNKKFSVACKLDVTSYGGDALEGSKTVYARFAVDTNGMTDPSSRS